MKTNYRKIKMKLILIYVSLLIIAGCNNLLTKSPITGNTDRFQYTSSITGVGAGPFITAVGLYNNDNDLMAVAKLAKPLKKPTDLPITFKVQIDI